MARPAIVLTDSPDDTGTVEFLRDLHDPGWRFAHRDPKLVDLLHRLGRVLDRETDVEVGFEPRPTPTFRMTRGRRELRVRVQGGGLHLRRGSSGEEELVATELSWSDAAGAYEGDPMLAIMKALAPILWPERYRDTGEATSGNEPA